MWYEPRNTYQHARTIGIAGQHIEPPLFIIRELLVFLSLGMIILVPAGGKKKKNRQLRIAFWRSENANPMEFATLVQ